MKHTGELHERVELAYRLLSPSCELCPRCCGVDRVHGELGECRTSLLPVVSSYRSHFGEEPPLVGYNGSGAIFFGKCNLKCAFCQNYEISQESVNHEISIEGLADIMLSLGRQGCHNINLVTPTHQVPQILAALEIAVEAGLDIPLVYNCGGYEPLSVLNILDGIIDIYMPDMKFGSNEAAQEFTGVPDYWDMNREALKEMHRQVGDLSVDDRGIAQHGLIIRHLILPNNLAHTAEVMSFIRHEISKDTYINIMDQYFPAYMAGDHLLINRRATRAEYDDAVRIARSEGLWRFAE